MSATLSFDATAVPPLEPLDALKARVDVVTFVERYVKLARRPDGHWGLCPFHQEKTPSFKVSRARRRWKCFGCDAGGDVIDFVAAIEGLDLGKAAWRLRELVDGPAVSRPAAKLVVAPSVADEPEPDAWAERNREQAQAIWRETEVIPPDGPPRRYLTERRGLSCWDPDRVRWHPACPWKGRKAGCLVVPVNDHASGLVVAVWRILPTLAGEVERRALGPVRGNAARLAWAPGPELIVTEGVEDTLAAREMTGLPAWAALNAGNMTALILPDRIREVLIIADVDDTGRTSARALAAKLRAEGREVRVRLPVAGKDANDLLLARRAA